MIKSNALIPLVLCLSCLNLVLPTLILACYTDGRIGVMTGAAFLGGVGCGIRAMVAVYEDRG